MLKYSLKVEGMMCGMCEAHICDVIRKTVPDAKKVSASRKKNEATFVSEASVDEEKLKEVINNTGYTCTGVQIV
jgi:copper chaperone CopZ